MKITTFLVIVSLFQMQANNTYGQKTKVTLDLENVTIEKVLDEIETLTDFKFMYNDREVDYEKLVTIKTKQERISSILKKLFLNTNVSFQVLNKQIVLKIVEQENKESISKIQQIEISGIITDLDGAPLPGANIIEKGTSNGTQSDFDGNFKLKVLNQKATIEISYIGFLTQEVTVNNQTNFVITLKESTAALDEVVVVGYGTSKRRDISGAVESISAKTIENKAATNVVEVLQGRMPGVNIDYGSGGIDSSPNVNIRGFESINGGRPLILIDGVPTTDFSILNQLNPNDIENVSVLKDASEAAIYGGRAAFGVVLITTKKGKNQKLQVTLNSFVKVSTQTEFPKFVDSYTHAVTVNEARLRSDAYGSIFFKDDWLERAEAYHRDPANNPVDEIVNPVYDSEGNLIGGDYYYYGTVDYMNEIFKKEAIQQQNNISLSGGSDKTSIYASIGYTKDEGFYRTGNEDLNNYTFRVNTSTDVADWLNVGTRSSYVKRVYNQPFQYRPSYYSDAYFQRTYFPLVNPGNGYPLQHPLAYLNSEARYLFEDDDITLNLNATLKLADGLKVVTEANYHGISDFNKDNKYKITFSDNFGYRYPVDRLWNASATTSHIYHRARRSKEFIFDIYANYNKKFGENHNIDATIGFNQQSFNILSFNAQRDEIITESVPSLNLATGDQFVGQSESHWAIRGAFYRLQYDFKDKYLLKLNGRYDGTSRFKKGERFGFFPSASAAWRVSKENFMKETNDWLNDLKLKASYGSLGNQQVSNYAYIATLGFDSEADYLFDGDTNIVSITNAPPLVNPLLAWETVTTLNYGLEASLFNNRLYAGLDIFKRETTGMIVAGDALPGILGTSAPTQNSADGESKGWEATLSWKDNVGDFRYGVRLNVGDSQGKITRFDNPDLLFVRAYYPGQMLGEIWGYETEGFFQTDAEAAEAEAGGAHDQSFVRDGFSWRAGDIKYKDLNGDGKIDNGNNRVGDSGDLKVIGNSTPRYRYGITLDLGWKGFSLEAFFQGVGKGQSVPPSSSIFWPYRSPWDNLQTHMVGNTWTPENPDAYYPQLEAYAWRNYETQTKYLQNQAYIRLKNISISYKLPDSALEKLPITGLTLSLNGRNVWEKHSLPPTFDPEGGNGLQAPFRRSYSFGVKVNL